MKDYLDHKSRAMTSTLSFDEGNDLGMTDRGFKKFRRRSKQNALFGAAAARTEPQDAPVEKIYTAPTPQPKATLSKASAAKVAAAKARVKTTPRSAGHGVRETPVLDYGLQEEAGLWQPQREMLPARLPDPWPLMRQVEVSGLNATRRRLPLVDFFRATPTARAFDLLRTRLLHTLRDHGWKRVAICAPTSGAGTSFVAANLALSLARVPGSRSILMDMNLRAPGVAQALGLERSALYSGDMLGFLRGEVRLEDHLVAASGSLALGLNGASCYNAAEVLHEPHTGEALSDMMRRTHADVVLYDLPPVLESDDVAAFLPQVDGVLLVSDGTQTTAQHLKACEKMLAGQTQLLGVVMNRARKTDVFAAAS